MPGTVQSIERAATLLHAIVESGGQMGVTELAAAVGLPKTTTHGLLRTLLAVGFVEQDQRTGRYAARPGTPGGLQVVVLHHLFRPDDSPQELEVGAVLPAHATAVGKVLLASRPAMARALTD